ncbi:MAG: signal transduction histidine kinase [Paracoccaceae bacterium]|jgi:signal transduction histidine kinase
MGFLAGLLPKGDMLSDAEIARLEKQMKDFVGGGQALFGQRQGMYFGSALLAGYYYSFTLAALCFTLYQITEFIDLRVSKKVMSWSGGNGRKAAKLHHMLVASSFLSSSAVSFFAFSIARMEGPSSHFTPLFFLFTAALFAAVNNHQMPKILMVRLVVYGFVFLFIPVLDIWTVRPGLDSVLWLQFATVLFVLYFVVDCSAIFLRLYRKGLDQLDELRLERDRAQTAFEVKSQFVSVVSHELRTPLTSILGALGLLNSGAFKDQPERAEKILGIAHNNSKRLSNLINDLLDLQKFEAGQMTYEFAPVNLSKLLNEAVESITGLADSSEVSIEIIATDQAIHARADADRILQVMANLLSNAVKFSKTDGAVEIALRIADGKAQISVRDYGIGIPANSRDLVFGKFSQVDSSDHRAFDGTGLGMSISEQIMKAHNGAIDYSSELGEGTTFRIVLPLS